MTEAFTLRPYTPADEDASIELWRRTWQKHYPHIDFAARLPWWRERWRKELLPAANVVVAEIEGMALQHSPFVPAKAGTQSQTHKPEIEAPGSPFARGRTEKTIAGFVTVEPETHYLDQIVVAPEHWGAGLALALLNEAKRLSPDGLYLLVNKDNARAIRFYEKHGFAYDGDDKNPVSGIAVNRMRWPALPAST
jgi:putative acetyltransferase